jgi:uncharacterized protein
MSGPTAASARPFHVLAKPRGAICNLDCKYCFFLSKSSLYPDSDHRMPESVLEAYIRQVVRQPAASTVSIAWQGGEPTLMGLPFFERAMQLVRKHAPPSARIEHTIQTNGTLLDEHWCEFFRAHGFLVGLSIDGPRELHDAYRVDKAGRPTFDSVLAAARMLQRAGVEFNVLCTVHAANAGHPLEVYRFFRDELQTRYLQLIPIVERATPELLPLANLGWSTRGRRRPVYLQQGGLVTERSVAPEAWGRFLIAIFDEWIARDVGAMFVQMFDAALAAWLRIPSPMCVFNETCGDALALEHNGDLYSCDHFVEPDHRLGNILDSQMSELVDSPAQRAFGRAKRDTLPRYCRECGVRFACNGECPRNRFALAPDGETGLNYLCAGYKAFFEHIDRPMRVMADLLRRGRYADEAMAILGSA